jgi:magnesium chelatase subunit D
MRPFPFSAVAGMDDVKLALLLVAVDPRIGGVLLRGQKGSAKTTLARGLAALLPGGAPFAELPVGATEDRLVGTIDLTAAITEGRRRFEPGILAAAHGGVLYVDEVNLLPDHLVDVLLDVAASGVNRVEREGVSHTHPARFVLVGSMNPEEGELRPQLLDRFGLSVDVRAPTEPTVRAEAVRRRLAFDADPEGFAARWEAEEAALRARLGAAAPAAVDDELLAGISALCAAVGAEGLRADLVIARAAAALAGLEGRAVATPDDVGRVAPLALAHRARRNPFDDHGLAPETLAAAFRDAFPECAPDRDPAIEPDVPPRGADGGAGGPGASGAGEAPAGVVAPGSPLAPPAPLVGDGGAAAGRRSPAPGTRGRLVGDRSPAEGAGLGSLAVGATAVAAALRRAADPDGPLVVRGDLREAVREQRSANLVVLAVDASGSMGAERRMAAAKGAVLGLLLDAYQRRDRVAMVSFRGEGASVVLRPTGSVEVARARLAELATGGRTPLAAGIDAALGLALAGGREAQYRPLIVLVSDGRATAAGPGEDPVAAALAAAGRVRRHGVAAVVIDAEDGPGRLGLARELAAAMGARHVPLAEMSAVALEGAIREMLT